MGLGNDRRAKKIYPLANIGAEAQDKIRRVLEGAESK